MSSRGIQQSKRVASSLAASRRERPEGQLPQEQQPQRWELAKVVSGGIEQGYNVEIITSNGEDTGIVYQMIGTHPPGVTLATDDRVLLYFPAPDRFPVIIVTGGGGGAGGVPVVASYLGFASP